MTSPDAKQTAIKAAMAVAKDVAEGRLSPAQVDDAALEACRSLFGVVAGPDDPLWPLQCEVARQVLAAGGISANELQEWVAVQRRRDGGRELPTYAEATWEAHLADHEPLMDASPHNDTISAAEPDWSGGELLATVDGDDEPESSAEVEPLRRSVAACRSTMGCARSEQVLQ